MPSSILALARGGSRRHWSDSGDSSTQLTSVPPSDASFSAGSTASIDSFGYPVEVSDNELDESYDPYLRPLMNEGSPRSRRKYHRGLHSVLKKSPIKVPPPKEPSTPDTAYESFQNDSSNHGSGSAPSFPELDDKPPSTVKLPNGVTPKMTSELSSSVDQPNEEAELAKARKQERRYWERVVNGRVAMLGIVHLQTAEGLIDLGNAHMECDEYKEALEMYKGATRVFRRVNGHHDLSVAKALDKMGLAACRLNQSESNLKNAFAFLHQALLIRHDVLGPLHVDTIDTLNNMAGVHLHLNELRQARDAYYEVWMARQSVFGENHPSVAVTAQALGCVHMRLSQVEEASKYYHSALDIYRDLQLSECHPSMARLLVDIAALKRIMSGMGYN